MESTEEVVKTTVGSDGGVTVERSNAPSDFNMAPRSETSNPTPADVAPHPLPPATEDFSSGMVKKKRGRPRKYGHDGAATGSSLMRTKYQVENLGEWARSSAGANFTPHIITVNAGEDVMKKIISFSQQESLAICVLSANGVVSSVTLGQPGSTGGTLTYEGPFEILSLSGTFMPSESDGTQSKTGGMSVSLASPDGRVLGGGVAGLIIAATPIQVVVGSFLPGTNQEDQNPKKQNHNFMSSQTPTTSFNAADYRNIRPRSSSLQISTWTPPLPSDPRRKPSHDINLLSSSKNS